MNMHNQFTKDELTQSNCHSYLVCLFFTLWPFLCLVTFQMFFITLFFCLFVLFGPEFFFGLFHE